MWRRNRRGGLADVFSVPEARVRKLDPTQTRPSVVRIGFVPLVDAGPLVAAAECGFFADEGLDVRLEQQIGWGNVRDRLMYGELHASHAPIGMVPASAARLAHYDEPLSVLVGLGTGGNAITIAASLVDAGDGTTAPARWRKRLGRTLNLAHVFSVATHHYAIRRLLDAAGLQIDADARLCVLPPAQMSGLLKRGAIDGYCAGEPWNTLAVIQKTGTIFCATTEFTPDHPEKVLAVTKRWLTSNVAIAERIVRAIVRGCDFCEDLANRSRLVEILADPRYLAVDEDVIAKSLSIDEWLRPGVGRPRFRSFGRAATVPSVASLDWIINEMIRWGQLPATTDIARLSRECVNTSVYATAIASLKRPDPSSTTRQLQGTRL
jgi:two-component system, oxyanion-binding sensor